MTEFTITHKLVCPELAAAILTLASAIRGNTPIEEPVEPPKKPLPEALRRGRPPKVKPAAELPAPGPEAPAATEDPEELRAACRIENARLLQHDMSVQTTTGQPCKVNREKAQAIYREAAGKPDAVGKLPEVPDDKLPGVLAKLKEIIT